MHKSIRWLRAALLFFVCLAAIAWLYEASGQWRLRLRGQRLMSEVKSLQVGSAPAHLDAMAATWGKGATMETECRQSDPQHCYYLITFRHALPSCLRGDPQHPRRDWIAGLIDRTGLRSAAVGLQLETDRGVITRKSFYEEVDLPVRDWYLRGGAYVPSLAVSSEERAAFRDSNAPEQINQGPASPAHPFRYARRFNGPWGLGVSFIPSESAAERDKLMDFRFSCITAFLPCRNEREILPEGARLLESTDQ